MIEDLERLANKMSAGSASIGDWETLFHYAKDKDVVVELGTNVGSTAMILSYAAKKVVTIDVFEDIHRIEDPVQRNNYMRHWAVNQHTFASIEAKLFPYHNILVHKNLSYEAVSIFEDNEVDLVFIDADHSYYGVKRDYTAWFKKIKHEGFFAFHDVGPGCPVFDFYNNELLSDSRIALMDSVATGPCWTKVFQKIVKE